MHAVLGLRELSAVLRCRDVGPFQILRPFAKIPPYFRSNICAPYLNLLFTRLTVKNITYCLPVYNKQMYSTKTQRATRQLQVKDINGRFHYNLHAGALLAVEITSSPLGEQTVAVALENTTTHLFVPSECFT